MKLLKINLLILALGAVLLLPALTLVQATVDDNTNKQTCLEGENLAACQKRLLKDAGGGGSGYGSNENITVQALAEKVGRVVGMVLSVFGIVFFCLVVYSGIQWMTAGGNEEKVTHARERIIRAAIGLGIVMMAYALTSFIVSRMQIRTEERPGQVINCSAIENQLECRNQSLYCQWNGVACVDVGGAVDCSLFNDETACLENDCVWTEDYQECSD